MHHITLMGLIIILLVALATAGGWATSGTTRLARELGFLLGLLAGLIIAPLLLPYVSGWAAALILLLIATIGGGMLGAAALGQVGFTIALGLHRAHLGSFDRLLGAALSALGTLIACALVLRLLVLFNPVGSFAHAAQHDAVAHWLIHVSAGNWL